MGNCFTKKNCKYDYEISKLSFTPLREKYRNTQKKTVTNIRIYSDHQIVVHLVRKPTVFRTFPLRKPTVFRTFP